MQTNVKAVELRDLWRRYKTSNDQKARDRLVVAYSPLVKYVAGRMGAGLPAHVDEADLISYGLGGLIAAIERFDLSREIRFETYAITRIKGAILDELRALDWVPRSVRARARQIERANIKLEAKLQRVPTEEELAGEMEMSVEEFRGALRFESGLLQVLGLLAVHHERVLRHPDTAPTMILRVECEHSGRADYDMVDVALSRADGHGVDDVPTGAQLP